MIALVAVTAQAAADPIISELLTAFVGGALVAMFWQLAKKKH